MSDIPGKPGAFLYFWPRYLDDTRGGPILRLNQNSAAMAGARPGDVLWVFAPVNNGQYAVVARLALARVGENPAESDARKTAGRWFVEADPGGATYFDPAAQPDASALIRGLGLRAEAAVLGQAFQGGAAVRRLPAEAARALADAASGFPVAPRLSSTGDLPPVNIRALRSRQAVLDAIAEHDQLLPGEFLRQYGYGDPDRYWILHEGRRYPSKAILGVAWHHEDPSRPPLRPSQFSGGRATVQRTAEALGFEVVADDGPIPDGGASLVSRRLTVGEIYTRSQLGQLLDVNSTGMGQGVFRRRGTASVLIFVTEDKPADRTQYVDRLEGDILLHWQGQESRRTDPLVIEHAARGLELLLFYRRRKDEFPGYGFRYLGPFAYVSHETPAGPGASNFVLHRADTVTPLAAPVGAQDADDRPFDLTDISDARLKVMRAIKERRGQANFRRDLIAAYGGRCAVTGCAVLDVLEAAHIHPYRGDETNHPANGLLLRADLHTLFDCGLISVAFDGGDGPRLIVAPALQASEYGALDGRPLRPREPGSAPISAEALALRHAEFIRRHGR